MNTVKRLSLVLSMIVLASGVETESLIKAQCRFSAFSTTALEALLLCVFKRVSHSPTEGLELTACMAFLFTFPVSCV